MNVEKSINELYGGKLRVRVCGFCFNDGKILLIKHDSKNGDLWLPPGGGLEYTESIEQALKREFIEETNIEIQVENFLSITEFIDLPLHAIELFYKVKYLSGESKLGFDPESNEDEQIIKELKWMTQEEVEKIPNLNRHKIIQDTNFKKLTSFFSK